MKEHRKFARLGSVHTRIYNGPTKTSLFFFWCQSSEKQVARMVFFSFLVFANLIAVGLGSTTVISQPQCSTPGLVEILEFPISRAGSCHTCVCGGDTKSKLKDAIYFSMTVTEVGGKGTERAVKRIYGPQTNASQVPILRFKWGVVVLSVG